jgi:hypothetical protein
VATFFQTLVEFSAIELECSMPKLASDWMYLFAGAFISVIIAIIVPVCFLDYGVSLGLTCHQGLSLCGWLCVLCIILAFLWQLKVRGLRELVASVRACFCCTMSRTVWVTLVVVGNTSYSSVKVKVADGADVDDLCKQVVDEKLVVCARNELRVYRNNDAYDGGIGASLPANSSLFDGGNTAGDMENAYIVVVRALITDAKQPDLTEQGKLV